jgi:ATP-dependent helicase/nuclease subunit B
MAATLCPAPPASGKTQWAVNRIGEVLKAERLAVVWVIVPDRLQAHAFRSRLALGGGALGAQVGTFGDVYSEVLERAGVPTPVVSNAVTQRLLQTVLDELARAGRLEHYQPLARSRGFAHTLRERFAELKRARVTPEEFLLQVRGEDPGLGELSLIYQAYQARLHQLRWADPEGVSWLAVEALERNPRLLADWRLVVLDGFDDFNPTQLKALELLGQQAAELLVTLPGIPIPARAVHQRFRRSLGELQRVLKPQLQPLDNVPFLPPGLAELERLLLERSHETFASGRVHLVEAQSPGQEAREALRWIKAQVVRGGLACSDCAVFVPDPELYHAPLRVAAREFGLPVRFTQGVRLVETPAVTALTNLLQLRVRDYPRRLTLDCIRSPYFDLSSFGLNPSDAALLEAAGIQSQVVLGKEQWLSALAMLSETPAELALKIDEDAQPAPRIPRGDTAAQLAEGLCSLMDRIEPASSQSYRSWIVWLEDLLEALGFIERCEPLVLENLRHALRALTVSDEAGGRRECGYQDFTADLNSVLQTSSFDPDPRSHRASLLVGRLTEARGVRFQAVAILGLSEGIFPAVERPDPLLSEDLRQRLNLEPRLGRNQAGLFYLAATRADRSLLLTRPYLAAGGEAWEPSHFWTAVEKIFPNSKARIKPDVSRRLVQAASRAEALFWAVRQGSEPQSDSELVERAQQVAVGRKVLADRTAAGRNSPYDGAAPDLAAEMAQIFDEHSVWSASRLETYAACPFQFFIGRILSLEPKVVPELGFDAAQLGSMLHAILERVYRPGATSLDALLEALPQAAAEVFAEAPQRFGFRPSPLWEAQKEQLTARLEKSITALDAESDGWTPFAFELGFGLPARPGQFRCPPLVLQTDVGPVQLRGVIDRVDRSPSGQCRVIDYKTGSSRLSPRDLRLGYRLQLPIYALAAEQACGVGEVVDGCYWSINQAKPHLKLKAFTDEDEQGLACAARVAQGHIERIVSGIRQAMFVPQPPEGGCSSYCPGASWCWQYEPGFG